MQSFTSPNKRYTLRRLSAARLPQNRSRASPFVRFCGSTFGAVVNASHCPITCPKSRISRTLSAISAKYLRNIVKTY